MTTQINQFEFSSAQASAIQSLRAIRERLDAGAPWTEEIRTGITRSLNVLERHEPIESIAHRLVDELRKWCDGTCDPRAGVYHGCSCMLSRQAAFVIRFDGEEFEFEYLLNCDHSVGHAEPRVGLED